MKKFIAIALLLAMCLSIFAGCADKPASSDLDNAADYLFNLYKGTGSKDEDIKISSDKELLTVVKIDGVDYQVTWSVTIVSGDENAVSLTDGSTSGMKKIDLADTRAETKFSLVAEIKAADGKTKTVTFNCVAPEVKPVEVTEDKVTLYYPTDSKYITGVQYDYTSSSGSTKAELVLSDKKSDAVVFTMRTNDDGSVTFVTDDGKYLFCDGNNVMLAAEEGEFTIFTLEAAEGGSFIKSNAYYNDNPEKPQYLEVYSGYLTCYGMSADKANIYTFVFDDAEGAGTTTVHVHTPVVDEAVAPTCSATGLTEGKHCSECSEVLVAQEEVKVLDHTPGEPTQENLVVGGCGEAGSYDSVIRCTVCQAEISSEHVEIPGGEHTFITVTERVEPTCTTPGSETKACECGATDTQPIPVLDHTPGAAEKENEVPATATTEGSYESVVRCSVCNTEISRETVKVPVVANPTSFEDLQDVTELQENKAYYIESVNVNGHLYMGATMTDTDGRIDCTADVTQAVAYKLESAGAEGEYYIYCEVDGVKTYVSGAKNTAAGLDLLTAKDDSCIWVIDVAAKTIINKATSNRGLATQSTKDYVTVSFYATSNFSGSDYDACWLMEMA